MSSFGDTAPAISVYCPWELKDDAGNTLDTAQRKDAFEKWCVRMLRKSLLWQEQEAVDWVADCITPGGHASVHSLMEAFAPESGIDRKAWKTARRPDSSRPEAASVASRFRRRAAASAVANVQS